ncbi:MAG TPA: RIP metalloprotease RseP [Candidatus Acidoferrum sp.]|jgi:regulator of sigma E protease
MALDIAIGVALVLGIIILVHEWGHFIVARMCKVRVDVFSIGFGPRLFGWKRGATDWRISALPLGGYVRMAGQDLSDVDSNDVAPTGAADELMSKPRWQRALIAFGGPLVNFIFPLLLLGVFYGAVGLPQSRILKQPLQVSYLSTTLAKPSPLQVGDRVIELNGLKNPTWESGLAYLDRLPPGSPLTLTVENKGVTRTVQTSLKDPSSLGAVFGFVPFPPVIDNVSPRTPAKHAGLRSDDRILEANGRPISYWGEFVDVVHQSKGQPVALKVGRDGKQLNISVTPKKGLSESSENNWQIGVVNQDDIYYQRTSLRESTEYAFRRTGDFFTQTLDVVGRLFSGRASVKQLQSVVGIAQVSGDAVHHGPSQVVVLMAFISVNLGILNLLPIPILDGGQILLLSIEGLMRRDFSMAVKERFVQVGFVFLLLLFAYVMYNDVVGLLPIHS